MVHEVDSGWEHKEVDTLPKNHDQLDGLDPFDGLLIAFVEGPRRL